MTIFYVFDEEGDMGGRFEAVSGEKAANDALKQWGLEADPGYGLIVFEEKDGTVFQVALHMERAKP